MAASVVIWQLLRHGVPATLEIPGKFETPHAKDSVQCDTRCMGLPLWALGALLMNFFVGRMGPAAKRSAC